MNPCLLWQRLPAISQSLKGQRLQRWHPWAAAALALERSPLKALRRLRRWRRDGLPAADLALIAAAPARAFPLLRQPMSAASLRAGPEPQLLLWAPPEPSWSAEAWKLQLPAGAAGAICRSAPPPLSERLGPLWRQQSWLGLHLQPVELSRAEGHLFSMAGLEAVFDPDPERVDLLRRLGINAIPLSSGPLEAPAPSALADASRLLGLPNPHSLGQSNAVVALGGAEQAPLVGHAHSPLWCVPGFQELNLSSSAQQQALVHWLNNCQRQGLQLVRLCCAPSPAERQAFAGLTPPDPTPPGWMPVQFFREAITAPELLAELQWRREGCARPPATCHTPEPPYQTLWTHEAPGSAAAASVCISLYNYGDRIGAALESVRQQTQANLELIVVDDHSSDGGEQRVQRWLEQHGHGFSRALLLRHTSNGGLASARNTAFRAASSPWCFVLDADNALLPLALERCLQIAGASDASTAVVHPLVEQVDEANPSGPPALLGGVSWQRQHFLQGNVVDAMALVRREAWQAVGGYTHIPGGWEDFDFWCKLIEAGWHGVLCPQRLATYVSHSSSMLNTNSNRQVRRLSRLLQSRHPWLQLPMAQPDA